MNALLEFFMKVKEKPQIYVGDHPSYKEFLSFLGGYASRIEEEDPEALEFSQEFLQYILEYYNLKGVLRNGYTVINLFTESDEAAFYKFFELLDEYLKQTQEA